METDDRMTCVGETDDLMDDRMTHVVLETDDRMTFLNCVRLSRTPPPGAAWGRSPWVARGGGPLSHFIPTCGIDSVKKGKL